jgi:3-dehydroquinate dehydratase II
VQKKFLTISGPHLNRVGTKDVPMGEEGSLGDIRAVLSGRATEPEVQVDCFQFNGEDEIIDCLQKATGTYEGAIIDAGALAHSGDALRSAIRSASFPCVEVVIAKANKGEESHRESMIASACVGVIGGFGQRGFLLALDALVELTNR